MSNNRDQELRFTVHDSLDYYQLKISIFNDDKKTDLIGEAWVSLRDIIVPGGGQSDQWAQLSCRGKYAGEIRIEITYYDTRPKPEKPAAKAKQQSTPSEADSSRLQQRPLGARRPLPSDPVTGKPPPQPPLPEPPTQTPPRPQPNLPPALYPSNPPPAPQIEYKKSSSALARYYQQDQDGYAHSALGDVTGSPSPQPLPELPIHQYHAPERRDGFAVRPDDQAGRGSIGRWQQPHDRQASRTASDADLFLTSNRNVSPEDDRPPPPPVHRSRKDSGAAQDPAGVGSSYDSLGTRGTPPTMRHDVLRSEAHRHSMPVSYPGKPTYKPYDPSSSAGAAVTAQHQAPAEDRYLPAPPPHSSFDTAYDPGYRSLQPTVEDVPESPDPMAVGSFRRSCGSYVSQYDLDMDPSVSPAPLNVGARGPSPSDLYGTSVSSTEHRRRSSSYGHPGSLPSRQLPDPTQASRELIHRPPRELQHQSHASREVYDMNQDSSDLYNAQGQRLLPYRDEFEENSSTAVSLPSVPPSLVPGMDPVLVQEISQRIKEDRRAERRYTQPTSMSTPPRGRQVIEAAQSYQNGQDASPPSRGAVKQQQPRSCGSVTYSGGPATPSGPSPNGSTPASHQNSAPGSNPHHTIRRKSVSPVPAPAEDGRLSGVPFGPDSYDALNPGAAAVQNEQPAARPDCDEVNGKIITHDGREVDPSDHLPMDTWAPEPEPRKAKPSKPSQRQVPSGPQSLPSSGRRQLRIAGRPHSMAPASGYMSHDISFSDGSASPPPPNTTTTGTRNRLQKKINRGSAMPVMSGANTLPGTDPFVSHGSTPLAPLPHHQDNNSVPPRALPRPAKSDYQNENHAPPTYKKGSGGGSFGSSRAIAAPPVPAKVPLALPAPPPPSGPAMMSGALVPHSSHGGYDDWGRRQTAGGGGGGELSLMEEMQRIDIGSGRSRRHGRGY